MAVARARRRLGMMLHGERRTIGQGDAAIGAVEQRHMGLRRVVRQRFAVDARSRGSSRRFRPCRW